MKDAVWSAVVSYLQQQESVLRVDVTELAAPRIGVFEHGNFIQVYSQRVLNGIPVRNSSVSATINHGNMVLLGLQNWGDVASLATAAQVSVESARLKVSEHVQPEGFITSYGKDAHLEYLPMVAGDGYEYRLVWAIRATVQDDIGSWEALVDAVSGEIVAFQDKNEYVARNVIGGVYPVSNDQRPPDGIEQPGYPMPFLNVSTTGSGNFVTNSAGTLGCATGTATTALVGQYTNINDTCGAINETSVTGDLDLGFGPTPTATDCTVPAGHSAGDTKSARSAFYELTRINEQARGWLPTNTWLQTSLLANVNVLQTCNANWNGTSVQFFRDSGSTCRNTGEIAAIFDHEWGHGMDNNGVNPNISGPGEAIADIHAILRLNTSCVGRGFFKNQTCGGYGDACIGTPATGCTGVRDSDFANHRCNRPHGISWINNGFTAAECAGGAAACPAAGSLGPCNRETHCEGQIAAEVGWDLQFRDLRGGAFNYDAHTALELATRLSFLGSQGISNWYTCSVGGGCGATSGYQLFLAADDDNGNLTDGTPHITAIRAAFARHEISCATPAAGDSGCAGGPTARPTVTAVPQDQGVTLTWNAVGGATRYYVYQTEGPNGAAFGKNKIAEVTGTTFLTTSLRNGRPYFFSVLPVGSNTSCFGLMSTPVLVTPVAGANVGVRAATTVTIAGGDGDGFLDNCETATVTFTVENTGTGPLTNVRLTNVVFLTHPSSVLVTTLPAPIAATLADCATANGSFQFTLQGATPGQSTQIRIEVTADQLAGQTRSQIITIGPVEQDTQTVATRTYTFDATLDGWSVISGTWTRTAPGALGTPFHVSSTENTPDNCDAIRSPAIRLKATSTMSLHNRFQIEPTDPAMGPYDRANVGIRTLDTGARTIVSPSGGQLYTTNGTGTGTYGACEQTNQPGWNGNSPGFPAFNQSTWTAAALNPAGVFTNRLAHIEIRYGTDPLLNPAGFDYDQVTVTDFDDVVPDVLPNACIAEAVTPVALTVDAAGNSVMEPNELAIMAPTWRNIGDKRHRAHRCHVELHRSRRPGVQQPRQLGQLRDHRRVRTGQLRHLGQLLQRPGHGRDASVHPLGQHHPRDRDADVDHEDLDPAHRCQLPRRSGDQRVLPLHGNDPPQERDRRLRGRAVLPRRFDDPRADGRFRARVEGGSGLHARRLRRRLRDVHRRPVDQPLLPLDRRAGSPRRRHRLLDRTRPVLPDRFGDS